MCQHEGCQHSDGEVPFRWITSALAFYFRFVFHFIIDMPLHVIIDMCMHFIIDLHFHVIIDLCMHFIIDMWFYFLLEANNSVCRSMFSLC